MKKYQENMTHNQEKNQSIETDPEMTMIELAKADIISILHMFKNIYL